MFTSTITDGPHPQTGVSHGYVRNKSNGFDELDYGEEPTFAAAGITSQQFNILRILRGSFPKPISTLQLRERMLEKMSDTSRIVDRLIAKGLVKKITCKTDRRLVDVIITDKGKKLLENLDKKQEEMDQVLAKISEEEANILSNLLDKIRDGA